MRAVFLRIVAGIACGLAVAPVARAVDASDVAAPIPQRTAISVSMVVSVSERTAAAEAIIADAEARGGYFALRTPDQLVLRVPLVELDAHLAAIAAQGRVLERMLSREDLSRSVAETAGRIEARQEILARYEEALDRAQRESVVTVERRIGETIDYIELLAGRLQVLDDRAAFARIDVSFRFRDRTAPAVAATSPFRWVNEIAIHNVHLASQRGSEGQTQGASVPTPAGFGRWQDRKSFRATSPDGVTYRVRTIRHSPRAELGFWREAVEAHLSGVGYQVRSSADIVIDGQPGVVIELLSPVGPEDWSWLLAFAPAGRRLVIAEAAGEITKVDAHHDAILTSIADIDLR